LSKTIDGFLTNTQSPKELLQVQRVHIQVVNIPNRKRRHLFITANSLHYSCCSEIAPDQIVRVINLVLMVESASKTSTKSKTAQRKLPYELGHVVQQKQGRVSR
jgi:hypothetical protein